MPDKEATARIKINKLLEAAGWRFFADGSAPANIRLEPSVTIKSTDLDALGANFEKSTKGFVDFLLLDAKGFPLLVLEAKAEGKNPLVGKEQARKYAKSQNCRFVMLSNGNLHYFWDLERGSPYVITSFPTPDSVTGYQKVTPNPQRLIEEQVGEDYIVRTQRPNYAAEAAWQNEAERPGYIQVNKLRFLRPYQLKAIHSLQTAVGDGKDRFLFEMATGTGKTLTAAAVIKLFLRSGNVRRVLFLVDRLELEDQAKKSFNDVLSTDYQTVIYKENRDDWRRAEVVVTTVQSLLFNNKYQKMFSPTDFDLVISDEAHRSIGGNARAVFDYFIGYKLGLTATPRDYLRRFDCANAGTRDPREAERRLLLDTYRTFGCENSQPTFRYSLLDGVKEGFLINPTVVDARTEVTTTLLSEEGFVVSFTDDAGEDQQQAFKQREFEKRFFADTTNQLLCKTFLENALRDPVSGEIGKSIIFAVSQNHAAKLAQILNQMADRLFPAKYQSDFAVQVTSQIPDAQQFTINFANNNLLGSGNFIPTYKTSKARICVTVGMMTTGYDCTDILNIGLFRPIFSPTDFIQIKGRGTRKHDFRAALFDDTIKEGVQQPIKTAFKLFDFFANCEYFEEDFNYDEVLKLPPSKGKGSDDGGGQGPVVVGGTYEHLGADILASMRVEEITAEGMKIDRMFFEKFEDVVRANDTVAAAVEAGQWDRVIDYVNREVFDKPEEYYTLDKLRKAAAVDRRLTLREILEKVFGLIPRFKSKDELLEEEFSKFVADRVPEPPSAIPAIKTYFKAYVTSNRVRDIIDSKHFTDLATNPFFTTRDFRDVPQQYRTLVPEYIKDYVSLNQFAP
ncbi:MULTISPECIES: DEAD/DEAH box helicase family protein [Acidithiobacillus]|uniref:Restriction endonuclease subunit R n=5 Tax=Acidithiobacillus TaxID=119977 RepID=A0A2W1KSZ9_ACIFR|nr:MULTISPECIES: DEAD/DEAH box helicase family protein [Acidithiobacillus]MBU2814563.1 DEAD/DEAH box helicase family protein [Acidithiobacillus ferruginosus]MBU2816261.1 DEAD/DEAH box helicase family protein [Acidithiobacillus ferrooxidans]MCR1343348.1 DEAD/DEAH box helicase family protein [Acidithiobacillus ferrooxidans]PZD82337.1 restriction endonuclease subunit R [Acidithiobacillus ferrooxidans]QLK41384.1 DEAD/DEAH box helicase [Acidithiobacillus ferrooxidans]